MVLNLSLTQTVYLLGMLDQQAFSSFRFDPFDPDWQRFPNARAATAYETTVGAGAIDIAILCINAL